MISRRGDVQTNLTKLELAYQATEKDLIELKAVTKARFLEIRKKMRLTKEWMGMLASHPDINRF